MRKGSKLKYEYELTFANHVNRHKHVLVGVKALNSFELYL